MVTDARRGGGMFGCLFSLVIFLGILYFGISLGRPYFRFERYEDEMKSMARFASTLTDSTIRLRLNARADSLGLPPAARKVKIVRSGSPERVEITAKYEERLLLLFVGEKILTFEPRGESGP